MAKPSSDGKYVIVEPGDTLSEIAEQYFGGASKYNQLATINGIKDPNKIYVNQKIYLTSSGSGGSSPAKQSNKPTITQFGLLSTDTSGKTLFAMWDWNRKDTASYKVVWSYYVDGLWFTGNNSSISVDEDVPDAARQSTYQIPSNAMKVKFKVKPIAKSETKNNKTTYAFEADWSKEETFNCASEQPPGIPPAPTVEIKGYELTMSLTKLALDPPATDIEFEIVKDNRTVVQNKIVPIAYDSASYSYKVDAGSEYMVRCRAIASYFAGKSGVESDWSPYSNSELTPPATPTGQITARADSKTSIYFAWDSVATATSYNIEYATKEEYFDGSSETTTSPDIKETHYLLTGLESGTKYFARIRAKNAKGESGWSEIVSITIGTDPAAPTTWASTTTAIVGEELTLYWVHNTEDGSSQVKAELELTIDGNLISPAITVENTTDEEEKDKNRWCKIDTVNGYVRWTVDGVEKEKYLGVTFKEGVKIQWRVRTAGITREYGDWSVQRVIDIYAPAKLDLNITDINGNSIKTLTAFPFYVKGVPGPATQVPIGYHLSVAANEQYETTDNMGNPRIVNAGEAVYSKYFDTFETLLVELSAGNIDLENNISYTVTCTVSMNSGLTAESSREFAVAWTDEEYIVNAEIGIDEDSLTAYIQPYCEMRELTYRKVTLENGSYVMTNEKFPFIYGTIVNGATTATGEQVYSGTTAEGEAIYYCLYEEVSPIEDILMSVYRREFDGSFTELAVNLDGSKHTTITDPHPALDYARYRIVAVSKTTGAVSYYDMPGYLVGGDAVVIQWDEQWTSFETSEAAAMEKPAWSGSLLKLPYNIEVSDSNSPDVSLVEYVGREYPISYYGTNLGQTSSWGVVIDKNDKETLYALRRLQRWMGNVYVREPSGSGYWANVTVSFSQKYNDLTIPVKLNITRVEGGA